MSLWEQCRGAESQTTVNTDLQSLHKNCSTAQSLGGGTCGFGGCWGLRHPASNPDTLSPPIRTPSKGERGGKNKTRNPVRAYLVTVWQAVITCMANREI